MRPDPCRSCTSRWRGHALLVEVGDQLRDVDDRGQVDVRGLLVRRQEAAAGTPEPLVPLAERWAELDADTEPVRVGALGHLGAARDKGIPGVDEVLIEARRTDHVHVRVEHVDDGPVVGHTDDLPAVGRQPIPVQVLGLLGRPRGVVDARGQVLETIREGDPVVVLDVEDVMGPRRQGVGDLGRARGPVEQLVGERDIRVELIERGLDDLVVLDLVVGPGPDQEADVALQAGGDARRRRGAGRRGGGRSGTPGRCCGCGSRRGRRGAGGEDRARRARRQAEGKKPADEHAT